MLADILAGLESPRKYLPCKYFYDERGSRLFDRICELPEYYLTRCERSILERHAAELVESVGRRSGWIEYGAGSGHKTRILLARLRESVYFPVDISREHLLRTAEQLAHDFPHVEVVPVCADFTHPFTLPPSRRAVRRRVVYFSGSTIGNFRPPAAIRLLRQIAQQVGPGGGLLIGVDLRKDRAVLEPAYDDASGVTAEFNLNLLVRLNRELGTDFAVERFEHRAVYDERQGRIEMHLVSLEDQVVQVGDRCFTLSAGETICTEYSYKYSLEGFAELARAAGLEVRQVWLDEEKRFSVQLAVREDWENTSVEA